ncbi:MAG: serine hydrolase [Bacteroidetes bacterium]|jgi:CubicO group peptidase (beta-lactamase class C family)|nr:serine hydrolase [Bacteroidota bacterium]
MKKTLLFFASLLMSVSGLLAQDYQKRAQTLDSIFTIYGNKNMMTGSVLVAKNGKILLSKGYGMADNTKKTGNTGLTRFKLASVSKQFTAMGIMILQEQGKLSTDDKLSKYIPDYPNGDKIMVHHLLTHTSGIPSFTSLPVYDSIRTLPHTLDMLIGYSKYKPLEFDPGTKFNYSNSGYILLSYIIEKASGMKYAAFINKSVFKPLGMKNSGVCEGNKEVPGMAVGYTEENDKMVIAPFTDMSIPSGAGALYSTVEDMLIWDQSLYTEKLVKKETLQKIFTADKENYGYGWKISTFKGHKWISHNGGIEGFSTTMNRFTDDSLTVIILKNIDNQNFLPAHRLAFSVMFGLPYDLPVERKVVKVDESIYKKLCGEYEMEPDFTITITLEAGKLYSQATKQEKIEIFPEADYKYFYKVVNAQLDFEKNDKGEISGLILHQGGQNMPAKKIK